MKRLAVLAFLSSTVYGAGKASFEIPAIGDLVSIAGEGCLVTGDLAKGSFEVSLASCSTGIKIRDGHMCEDLDCAKFPVAKAQLTGLPSADGKFPLAGTLTIKGVEKPLAGDGEMKGGVLSASFKVRLADFGVKQRTHLGVGVGEVASVKVEFK
jgi:polyisoprenoid-binding protein YceI